MNCTYEPMRFTSAGLQLNATLPDEQQLSSVTCTSGATEAAAIA